MVVIHSPYLISISKRRRNVLGWDSVLPLGFWGMVDKSPNMCGGVPPMVSLPLLLSVMTSE